MLDGIGLKIKELRLENGLTQEELANRCELTKGFISQIENNLTSPSISTLDYILEVLGTSLGEFFSESTEENAYVFTEEDFGIKVDDEYNHTIKWIVPNAQKYEMEPIIIEIEPGGTSFKDEPHTGEEFGYVLEGEIVLRVGKKRYVCTKGNSFYYMANKFHYIENTSSTIARILWVSTPPMF